MANKKHLHHTWTKLRPISPWVLLALAVLFSVLFINAYRQNNLRMLELRDAVFSADEDGGDIEEAVNDLRRYVHGHMNTSLHTEGGIYPPIQLQHTFERLEETEAKRAEDQNEKVATEAGRRCSVRNPLSATEVERRAASRCANEYIDKHSIEPKPILKELYQFNFASPRWSPDLAGWSLVAAIFFGFLFVARFLLGRWLNHKMHTQE